MVFLFVSFLFTDYYYVSETPLSPVPSELDLQLLVNFDRTKRDASTYTEPKYISSTTVASHVVPELPHNLVPAPPPATPAKNDSSTPSHTNINVLSNPMFSKFNLHYHKLELITSFLKKKKWKTTV